MADQLLNLKLVGEIEKHPCLYNYTLNDYSRKDVAERAWNDVGQKVNLSGSECKERWKNLRAVFVRHMKPGPTGSSAKSKKSYYLADAMQFALPFVKTLNTNISGNLPSQIKIQQEINSDFEENSLILPSNYQMPPPCSPPQSVPLPSTSPQSHYSLPTPSPQSLPSQQTCPSQPKRRNKRPQEDYLDKTLAEYFRAKKVKLEEIKNPQHEANKMFVLSSLPDMNEMSLSQIRQFKKKVMDLIDEVLESSPSSSYSPIATTSSE